MTSPPTRAIIFGAFDRHNLGDLLFAHVISALWHDGPVQYAGLVRRDLRSVGGHEVEPLPTLAARAGDVRTVLIHAGGETLNCDAWTAAVMLQPSEDVQATIGYFEARPARRQDWVRRTLGTAALAPYVASPQFERVLFHGVGGVDLDSCEPALRAEVIAKLAAADDVGVRDQVTLGHVQAAGIAAHLVPDPAVLVAELFGPHVQAQAARAGLVARRGNGHIAVQFSADFGDDATLNELALQLDCVADTTGCAPVFFCAGAAPWHDDVEVYRRTVARMRSRSARIFNSLDIWELCGLIATSRAYCGSSLHGRIVAAAFGVPRVNIIRCDSDRATKQAAFARTWDLPAMPANVPPAGLADAVAHALAMDPMRLHEAAARLALRGREAFKAMREAAMA